MDTASPHPRRYRLRRVLKRARRWLQQRVPERLWLSWVSLRVVWAKDYWKARAVVQGVATDTDLYTRITTNRRDTWKKTVLVYAEKFPGAGEDVIRCTTARERMGGPQTSARTNALLELSYLAYKERT